MAMKKTVSLRLFVLVSVLLCVLTLLSVVFAVTAKEDNRTGSAKMEALCKQSASYASGAFERYERYYGNADKQPERYYRSALADFNVFLCMYYTLYGEDTEMLADYMMMFEIYDKFVQYPDDAYPHLHACGHALSALAQDPRDSEAMENMQTIRDALYETDGTGEAAEESTETEAAETE